MKRAALALLVACGNSPNPAPAPGGGTPPPDVTPPTVVARSPQIAAHDGMASGPYKVTFSEPMAASSITADTVRVWQGEQRMPAWLSLSADGQTLTVTPVTPLPRAWTSIELTTGLRDVAGNALAAESQPWLFEVPEWISYRRISPQQAPNPHGSVAIDATGAIVVGMGNVMQDPVLRLVNGAWTPLPDVGFTIFGSIAVDAAGTMWAADRMKLSRLDQGHWTRVGGDIPLSNAAAAVFDPRVVVSAGTPVFVWNEYVAPGAYFSDATSMHASAWNGASWIALGSGAPGPALWPRVAMSRNGAVVASWSTGDGARAAWVRPDGFEVIAAAPNSAAIMGTTAVAAGLDGDPILAFGELTGSGLVAIRVKKWDGAAWRQLGEDVEAAAAYSTVSLAMQLDGDGCVVLAWTAGAPVRTLSVARFDAAGWARLGSALNDDATHDVFDVSLALDAAGAPVLAWPEATGETAVFGADLVPLYAFHVKRLNH